MKKGFVISWFYPPGNSSEGIVTYKLLNRSKFKYDVWTRSSQHQGVWDRKVDESELVAPNVTVIPHSNKDPEAWIDAAVEYFCTHRSEYDFVMTRSMPANAHEVALRILERYPKTKWVASFGDPLVDTPYLHINSKDENPYTVKAYVEREHLSRKRALRVAASPTRNLRKIIWEKERNIANKELIYDININDAVIKKADLIIVNNQYQYDHTFSGGYAQYKEKGIVVNHSFEKSLFPENAKKPTGKIHFIYTGHLDNYRNSLPLLRAIAKMSSRDKTLRRKVVFDFYGHLADRDKVFIVDHEIYDLVKIHSDIQYLESLKKIKEANWALLFDANFTRETDTNIYFPAKLADYIGAGTNILAITQIQGATADIVRAAGGGKVLTHSADEIAIYLSKIIYQGYTPTPANQKIRDQYDAKNVAKLLDKKLKEVTK